MDASGDGGGGQTATALVCGSCCAQSSPTAKFCSECGTPLNQATRSAEYKQVTVLFADVVHSMDIAASVGPERLREIMAELLDRSTAVVQRYGGTVDKFTGDGIMAVFGAPVALEDHAVRACLAGLAIQEEAKQLAVEVQDRDGVELRLRGEPEMVPIKGVSEPVPACRLVALADHPKIAIRRRESTFVGRHWEMAALGGILDHVIGGHGYVLRVVGP